MTAVEIIEEIRRLPDGEREMVRQIAAEKLEPGQLPSHELALMVQKMIDAKNPSEAKRLEDEIVRGFYGNGPHA